MGTTYSKSSAAMTASVAMLMAAAILSTSQAVEARQSSWLSFATGGPQNPAFVVSRAKSHAASASAAAAWMTTIRGGETSTGASSAATDTAEGGVASSSGEIGQEQSLDEKVQAAMRKLGITASPSTDGGDDGCDGDGACPLPSAGTASGTASSAASAPPPSRDAAATEDPVEIANRIAKDMNVDGRVSMAAVGATATTTTGGGGASDRRIYNEAAARAMIRQELDLIEAIPTDSADVRTLTDEGYDAFLSRRALAFAEGNLDDARAILLADEMDADEEDREREEAAATAAAETQEAPDFIEVKANFDPTKLSTTSGGDPASSSSAAAAATAGNSQTDNNNNMPKPASKESVVFEATTAQIQELVLESPVPVLLDIYADWCGPCKVLGPALEDMAVKAGGMFRLVKINSDNERPVSQALGVNALPTVFAFRDGKIVHMFEGMPRSEDAMKNFMMGLFGAAPFSPPITQTQSAKYEELTIKLIKTAGSASFSFSSRELLTDRITTRLDELVQDETVADVEGTASLIRKLLNNVVKSPYDEKFRTINLENKVIGSKIGSNPSSLAVLKSVGFAKSGSEMVLAKGKRVINVAPLVVARDCIDKWIQRNRAEMAAAARKRKDEIDRARILAEKGDEEEEEEDEEEDLEEVDPSLCTIKLRLDGKKMVQEVKLRRDDPLKKILEELKIDADTEKEVQITCVAKRMVVKSSDEAAMNQTLEQHGLMPSAAIVVKVGSSIRPQTSNLKERAANKKAKKTGSHTMQSVGIYAKDDNSKTNLIDGGGGVWYDYDVSDDGDEGKTEETSTRDEDSTPSGSLEKEIPQQEGDDDDEGQKEEEMATREDDSTPAGSLEEEIPQQEGDETSEENM